MGIIGQLISMCGLVVCRVVCLWSAGLSSHLFIIRLQTDPRGLLVSPLRAKRQV